MMAWRDRPIEEARLLNPAFCGTLISICAAEYYAEAERSMPFVFGLMLLPIILHKRTRECLPAATTTSMPVWVRQNMTVRITFYSRLMALKPHSTEAIRFAAQNQLISLQSDGSINSLLTVRQSDRNVRALNGEAKECAQRARMMGKWLAIAGSPTTVMALWGIRP